MSEQDHEKSDLEKVDNISRRNFVKNSSIAVGGVAGGLVLGGLFGNPFKTEQTATTTKPITKFTEALQFFTRKEDFDTLAAATEVIFPEDDNGPGAIELGVPYYIDKQLASLWGKNADDYMMRPFGKEEIPLTRGDIMIQGIRKINIESQNSHKEDFRDLEEDNQIAILQRFESGEVEMNLISSTSFFALLRQLTIEGCYCDPLHGGNNNMDGWKMKEFPGAYMSYTDVVEAKEFVYKEPKSLSDHM